MVKGDPDFHIERVTASHFREVSFIQNRHHSERWWRYIFSLLIIAGLSLLTTLQLYTRVIFPQSIYQRISIGITPPPPLPPPPPLLSHEFQILQPTESNTVLQINATESQEAALQYVGSKSCAECHEKPYRAWFGSDHQLAMQKSSLDSIGADHFNGETFLKQGTTTTFRRKGGDFFIDETTAGGITQSYQVSFVFGLHPLQQFVVPYKNGRQQLYTIAWDTNKKEWFDLYPDEKITDDDDLSWKGHQFTWNLTCVECHTTNLEKNYDLKTNSYLTTFAEVSVGCEACHGPSSKHVELAKRDAKTWEGDRTMGLTVILKDVPINRIQIDSCAPCHSRRQQIASGYHPGKRFTNYYAPEFLEDDLYFPDGQIKDEVFVYGSFLQSRMYRENVKCSDCHNPHSGRIKLIGNALCLQCHAQTDYDTQLHYHHEAGKPGSQCIDCHMPTRTYMVVDPRRDHSMKIPRPDLSVKFGTPNACNQCHTDKEQSAQWAAEQIVDWFGPDRPEDAAFAEAFALARKGDTAAISLLEKVIRDETGFGPIVRGTAAKLLAPFTNQPGVITFLGYALHDRDPMVRTGAVHGLEYAPEPERIRLLVPLLKDRSRMVRIQAARLLDSVNVKQFPEEAQSGWRKAVHEYEKSLLINADSPDAQLNLGVFYTNLKETDRAITSYNQALRIDPEYVPALINLAFLQYGMGNRDLSEKLLRKAIAARPDFVEGPFMLGILLAEDPGRIDEAIASLTAALKLDDQRADIHYNLGLVYLSDGQTEAGLIELRTAVQQQEDNPQYRYTLIKALINQQYWDEALEHIKDGKIRNPDEPVWDQLKQYIDAHR